MMPEITQPASPEVQQCTQNCIECAQVCLETVRYCLESGGHHAQAPHVLLLLDCIEICQTSADFMMRGSNLHGFTCNTCAEVCRRCAKDCERFSDDKQMMACAEVCRRCAESCQ